MDSFCAKLLHARQMGRAEIGDRFGRELALAVAEQVGLDEDYCPEKDRRVLWSREVIASAWRGDAVPRASLGLEASLEFLRTPCGKFLAAGGDR